LAGATLGWLGGYWRGWWDASGLVAGLSPAATLWVATLAVGAGTAGMFPNGIALGRRMFPLDGFAQATFELGAATGAGVGPFVAAAAYRRTKDPATIPMTCVAAGVGALAALAVALAANAREKRRREGGRAAEAEEDEDEDIAALVRPLLDAREEGDSDDRRNDRRTPSSVV
jgi:MFS transporter, FHS family, Na+ dependent glucose transporter 1